MLKKIGHLNELMYYDVKEEHLSYLEKVYLFFILDTCRMRLVT